MSTTYENKLAILAELWMEHRNDEDFKDFFEYNDLGMPLAYALNEKIVEGGDLAAAFINETFDLLLVGLEISSENAYEDLAHLFDEAEDEGTVEADGDK